MCESTPLPEVTVTRTGGLYSVSHDPTDMPVLESSDLFELLSKLTANGPVVIDQVYDTEEGE